MGIAWEKKYAEFKRCVEMPEKGTPLFNWQQNQLSNTHGSSLNAKILKECVLSVLAASDPLLDF